MTDSIDLSIPSGSEAIQIAIFAKQQIVMPSCIYLFDLDTIGEDLDGLLCMHVHRIGDSKLPIFVEADRIHSA